jgi:streptogramin lyase
MKRRFLTLSGWLLGVCSALRAQTTTSVPAGVLFPTQNNARVNGVTVRVAPDGAVWFLESSADIIARLKDGVIRQWQIRPTNELGANPVDFQLDGDIVWFIESGQSQIPSGTCAYARLDTTTGDLTEWVVPGTIPAAFYRAPDGLVWLPQTAAVLQSFNLETLAVTNYRSPGTYSYADMVVGPDGAFWLADFGDNRIVRWMPGEATETSWTFYPLTGGRLGPSQVQFDDQGFLWISQRGTLSVVPNRVDRFDPATNTLYSYDNIANPFHFDIFQGRLYITSITSTSQVTVLDPNLAPVSAVTQLTPLTLDVGSSVPSFPVTIRHSTIVPTDFTSAPTAITQDQFTVTNSATTPGVLTTAFPSSNTYSITVVDGRVYTGTDGKLAVLNLQAVGGATDQSVPMATSLAGTLDSKVRIDVTVSNRGTASLAGQALYLDSPGSFAARATFTLAASATSLIADTFGNLTTTPTLLNGPVRLSTTTGSATDLTSTVRSLRVQPDGGTFGYLLPAETAQTSLQKDSTTTLFTGASSAEISILNLYSLDDAKTTLSLFGPDGTVRGTGSFDLAKNASLSFNPAASAFGVPAEPGDAVRVNVTAGTLQSSVLVYETGTADIAPALPTAASTSSVLPWVGSFTIGDRSFVSDLYLANPSADTAADVTVAFYGVGTAGSPLTTHLSLTPQQTLAVADLLTGLFGLPAGQGALAFSSNVPVAASVRMATRVAAGDYGSFANAIVTPVPGGASAFAIGLPETSTRTGLLEFFNSGAAGVVTVTGFKADGTPAGQLTVEMGDHAAAVVGPVFAALGVTNQPAGRVRVDVPAGMTVYGWAVAIDEVSGDFDITPLE